jgi:hypothetical protein
MFPLLARLGVLGRLIRRRLKESVAFAAPSTLCEDELLSDLVQINDEVSDLFRLRIACEHLRSHRKLHNNILASGAILAGTPSWLSISGSPLRLKLKIEKGLNTRIGPQNHGSATPSVTPIGTTQGHELFSAKASAASAALSRDYLNDCFIDKLHNSTTAAGIK